ncbi:hypothetical protein VP01_185g1 [Puccinia sorghi]|uniref:Uncharacterized protein n=1 Tax=Puccinia sorghi TaxID=27349 RepID=A0A0L6VDJ4_9BASI|nr:hypothetical protein VP01_185g1 [Puccinia sorghi]
MPDKEPSLGEASRSIPPINRLAKPFQNSSGVLTSTNTRLVGNYHQTPSHQLNTPPYHSPLNPSNPVPLPSSAQVPSNLTNTTYSNPPARHPSYGDLHTFLPSNHPWHPKASPSSSTPSHTSSVPPHQNHPHHYYFPSQQRLHPAETRKIVGQKRKSSASPSPEPHPENLSVNQTTNTTNRPTSKAWAPPSPLPTGNHRLNHPRAHNPSSYHPSNQPNLHPSSTQACESRPSSLAGLLANHPDAPHPPTEPSKLDVPYPTATEASMSRRDPDRSRGRPSITTSQNTSQIQPPPVSQRPPSAEQQWSSHHRSSLGCSPQISRNTMLSANDPAEPSTRSNYSKPSTPLTSNQTLPDRTTTAYGHPFRSETHHPAASNDMQHSRSPTVYYHSYPTHRQPNHPHPQQHHHPLYPPPLSHDHRPELHLRSNFSQQSIRHSSLSTPDGHLLPTQSSSRPDPDPKQNSHRLLQHQSPSHENHFLHPSQNRIHYSDTSRPSPITSNYPLPLPASRPSTSSSLTNQHPPISAVSQQTRHSHHLKSPSGSPDRPRLYQPEPRRVTLPSPDLQLQLSPGHQNTDLYPSQGLTDRTCQQVPPHPLRSSHTHILRSTHPSEDAHFSPPRRLERYPEQAHHSSVSGPPRHRSSMSTDVSHSLPPSRQSRPQPVFMHEFPPEFPNRPPPSLQADSDSHRHDHPSQDFSTHQTLSHESDQSPQIKLAADHPATDRARYAQSPPESFQVQHATYLGRDHLASPIVMQPHPSYSGPSRRQPLPTHYEYQQHPATQNEPPSNQNLKSSVISAEHPPETRPTVGSLHDVSFTHQANHSQATKNGFPSSHEHCLAPSPEAHQQNKRSVPSNNPRRNSRSSKVERVDELPRAGTSQLWSRAAADTLHMDHVFANVSNVSLSNKPRCNREKTAKSSSQTEPLLSKGSTNITPAPDPRLASQAGLSTGKP